MLSERPFVMALSANFTAEPLQAALDFWIWRLSGDGAQSIARFWRTVARMERALRRVPSACRSDRDDRARISAH
jgi:hypothetical protein